MVLRRPPLILFAAILSLWLVFISSGAASAADIGSFGQARDRLQAQVIGERTGVLDILGREDRLDGPAVLAVDGGEVSLGRGAGWLFAVKMAAATGHYYLVAFVREDGRVDTLSAKTPPAGLAPLAAGTEAAAGAVNVEDGEGAYRVLLDRLLGHSAQGRRIYLHDEKAGEAGLTLALWREEITISGGPGWLFFVDDKPRANWEHPCRYALVSETGGLTVVKATTPPSDMSGFKELTVWPGVAARAALSAAPLEPPSRAASTPAAHRYAVIISGGWNAGSNYPRYWNDCAYFLTTLKANGFLDVNIYVLMSDGTDPAEDRSDGVSSPLDLDGDGNPDIRYSATKANITAVFDELAGKLGTGDLLYIFTTDHGGEQTGNVFPYLTPDVVLCLWGEDITGEEFAAEVNKVTTLATVGIFEQCFSGGLVEKLKGANRVLMSASRWWELSYSAFDEALDYNEFSYHVTRALALTSEGDSNLDGRITLEEAYLHALARDAWQAEALDANDDNEGEHPAYYSNPWDLGRRISLGGLEDEAPAPRYAGYTQSVTPDAYPSGTAQGWHADDGTWTYHLPFEFPFGGKWFSSVTVSSNGIVYLQSPSSSGMNSVDGLAGAWALAPLWDDLTTADPADDIYVAAGAGRVSFIWKAKTRIDAREVNAAVSLNENGEIIFHYGAGNQHIGRFEKRDKTMGVSKASGTHFSLHNGQSELGSVPALTFTPVWDGAAIPGYILLLP